MASAPTPAGPSSNSSQHGPALPPPKDYSDMDSIPLFMKSLPDPSSSAEENPALEALRSLVYEGNPEEVAENLKNQANDYFRGKRYREALGFYTQAINEVGDQISTELKRTLLCNRAACHLELGNYGSCIRDCSSVLAPRSSNDPNNTTTNNPTTSRKALYRSSRALIALDKLEEAQNALQFLRKLDEEEFGKNEVQEDVKKLLDDVQRRTQLKKRREDEKKERERRKVESDRAIIGALKSRGLIFPSDFKGSSPSHSSPTDVEPPHFDPDSLPSNSNPSLPLIPPDVWAPPPPTTPTIFPIYLLRPLTNPPTRDLISSFHEDATFGDLLNSIVLPDDHDPSSAQLRNSNFYIITAKRRILKLGKKLSLRDIFKQARTGKDGNVDGEDGMVLVDGWALEIYLVDRGVGEEKWIAEMKATFKDS